MCKRLAFTLLAIGILGIVVIAIAGQTMNSNSQVMCALSGSQPTAETEDGVLVLITAAEIACEDVQVKMLLPYMEKMMAVCLIDDSCNVAFPGSVWLLPEIVASLDNGIEVLVTAPLLTGRFSPGIVGVAYVENSARLTMAADVLLII